LPVKIEMMAIIRFIYRLGSIAFAAALFSTAAAAGGTEDKDPSRIQGSSSWHTEAVQSHAPGRHRHAGSHISLKDQQRLGIGPAGHQVGVSYDPAKNMVRVHVPLNGKGDFDSRHHAGWSFLQAGHSERENRRLFGRPQFASVDEAVSQHAKSVELLEKAVNPTVSRFNHALTIAPPEATSVVAKTKFAIGRLPFAPFEVLGVNLDAASVERAEALGFKADKTASAAEGGDRIVRLFAPPNTDAIRAQELLSKELPGARIELNKVYRLYRASMRDEAGARTPGEVPSSAQGCSPERCFSRQVIQWDDQLSACARGLRIGVIDTGIDGSHPAFKDRRIRRVSFVPEGRPPASDWHGTGVLAILAGTPGSGTPGLVPDAEFYAASIFFAEEDGALATDTASLTKALAWMRDNDVKLINMSFSGPPDDLVKEAIEELSARGTVLVAAAGNEGPAADPAYPAAYAQVIAVTAVTKDLRNYRYANRGTHIDVAAPGVDIWSAVPGSREGSHTGTSFAAPHVTGAIAVMPREALTGKKDDLLDSMPVIDLGAPGRDPIYGRGLLTAPSTCSPPNEEVVSAEMPLQRAPNPIFKATTKSTEAEPRSVIPAEGGNLW
jgi:subtilisin family serine protease